ncbi:hypothetical protein BS47DRAFT_1342173 [Hydnum rufescens UP504]|uniref:Uncharacterized protein n=1 Tax=Hydnum rufescens UP504 TaxID=1448309 RepID=A0A9P6B1F5_9AGAM|nr:hypothetical protein BS47DRAFT_1342173 [Hydnum rufescens UP504]
MPAIHPDESQYPSPSPAESSTHVRESSLHMFRSMLTHPIGNHSLHQKQQAQSPQLMPVVSE